MLRSLGLTLFPISASACAAPLSSPADLSEVAFTNDTGVTVLALYIAAPHTAVSLVLG